MLSSARFVRSLVALVAVLILSAVGARAQQEARMGIVKGTAFKFSLEVQDFHYLETMRTPLEGGESCEELLRRDLQQSDFFEVRRELAFIPDPADSSNMPKPVEYLATGIVRKKWGEVVLEGELLDAASGKVMFRQEYSLGSPPDRRAVHAYADDIVRHVTGEAGVALSRIAFVGVIGKAKEVFLVDYDGFGLSQLTKLGSICLSPRFSADGERLAFTSFAQGEADLVTLALSDGRMTPLSSRPGIDSAPAWHPDGSQVAASLTFEGNAEIYVMDDHGKKAQRLTFSPAIETAPCFSPDGSRIVFTSDRTGEPHLWVMDSDGANSQRLSYLGKWSDSADWSPRGDRIVFVALVDDGFDIFTMAPDGSDRRRATANDGSWENPRWAPDGRHIVAAKRERGGQRRLFVMTADGGGKRALTSFSGDQYNPAWSSSRKLREATR